MGDELWTQRGQTGNGSGATRGGVRVVPYGAMGEPAVGG